MIQKSQFWTHIWLLLLLLLSRFSHVRLCATPQTAATRLPSPWDSPGKNTGVSCHFLLQCVKVKIESEVAQSNSQQPHGLQPTRLLHPWDIPGKSTGVGCHCLLHTFGKNHNFKDTCTPNVHTALFIIAKTWKQPKCPSTKEWIRKMW